MIGSRQAQSPARADSFHLELEGVSTGSFVSCSGLGARAGVFEYAEGGLGGVRKFRGETRFSSLLLERGVTRSRELYQWFERGDRRDGAVVLLSPAGKEVMRWSFQRGWPCRWQGPLLDARSAEVALELLEIAHEGLAWSEP
jgi:phage tail-like protein